MSAEAAQGVVLGGYARGLLCECGARRSVLVLVCAALEAMGGIEAATSPWWKEPDGVLARVRGDAAVVREIIRGLEPAGGGQSS
jgi:hypothetical protein